MPVDGELDQRDYVGVKSYINGNNKKFADRQVEGTHVSATALIYNNENHPNEINYSVGCIHDQPFCPGPGMHMLPYGPVPGMPYYYDQPNVRAHVLIFPDGVKLPRALGFSDHFYTRITENPGNKIGACMQALLPADLAVMEEQFTVAQLVNKPITHINHHSVDKCVDVVGPPKVLKYLVEDQMLPFYVLCLFAGYPKEAW